MSLFTYCCFFHYVSIFLENYFQSLLTKVFTYVIGITLEFTLPKQNHSIAPLMGVMLGYLRPILAYFLDFLKTASSFLMRFYTNVISNNLSVTSPKRFFSPTRLYLLTFLRTVYNETPCTEANFGVIFRPEIFGIILVVLLC